MVDALLLALRVQEVRNFELWEQERAAERVPAQDWGVGEQDCFRMSVAVIGHDFCSNFSVHSRPNFTSHSLPHLSPYAYL